jgi:hypothetical protein
MASVYVLRSKIHNPRIMVFVMEKTCGCVTQRDPTNGTICIGEFSVGNHGYRVGVAYSAERLRECWNQLTENGYWVRDREQETKWAKIAQGA